MLTPRLHSVGREGFVADGDRHRRKDGMQLFVDDGVARHVL